MKKTHGCSASFNNFPMIFSVRNGARKGTQAVWLENLVYCLSEQLLTFTQYLLCTRQVLVLQMLTHLNCITTALAVMYY